MGNKVYIHQILFWDFLLILDNDFTQLYQQYHMYILHQLSLAEAGLLTCEEAKDIQYVIYVHEKIQCNFQTKRLD